MNSRTYVAVLAVLFALPLASCGESSETETSDNGAGDGFVDDGFGGDDDDAQDAGGAEDTPDASPEPEPMVEPYNFQAAAPWYECPAQPAPEGTVEVVAMDKVLQHFTGENRREIDVEVDFPEEGQWAQVGLVFQLECPPGGVCDHWDRTGSLQLVTNPEAPPEEQRMMEILRHITPYRIGMCQYVDVTPLAQHLKGRQVLRSFIDTWVGPGHDQGEGWAVSARFVFTPGQNAAPKEVINIWGRRNITVGEVEPEVNVDSQIDAVTFELPEGVSRVTAHLIATGHSFGNTSNCAEFCQMRHDVIVNGTTHSLFGWRNDCAQNPVSPQFGTWEYNRNGWCPGAVALGQYVDISDALVPGENTIDFDILTATGIEYDNLAPVDLLPYTVFSLKLYAY